MNRIMGLALLFLVTNISAMSTTTVRWTKCIDVHGYKQAEIKVPVEAGEACVPLDTDDSKEVCAQAYPYLKTLIDADTVCIESSA